MRRGEPLILLGPGGVGKSTLGRALAEELGWKLIDLDTLFCSAIGMIGEVIADKGYEHYRAQNLSLAERCMAGVSEPTVLVTSSGFLAAKSLSDDLARATHVVACGYGVTVLPSLDIEKATEIVVARQLRRGFGFTADSERRKFQQRFKIYRPLGDMLVVSLADPAITARAVTARLQLGPGR